MSKNLQKLIMKEFAKLEKKIEKIFEREERNFLKKMEAKGIIGKPLKVKPKKKTEAIYNVGIPPSKGGVMPVCQVCHYIVEAVDGYGICRACSSTIDAKNLREKLDHEFISIVERSKQNEPNGFALFEIKEEVK